MRDARWAAMRNPPPMTSRAHITLCTPGVMSDGETIVPLLLATKLGHLDCVKALLQHGANHTSTTSPAGLAAVHVAVQAGHADVLGCLLEQSSDPNQLSGEGSSPLHLAAALGHVGIVERLLTAGAEQCILIT